MESKIVAAENSTDLESPQDLWIQVPPVDNTGMLRSVVFAQGNFYAVGGNGLLTTTQLIGGGASGTEWIKLKGTIGLGSEKLINKLYWNGIGITLQALSQAGSVTTGHTKTPASTWTNRTTTLGASGDLQDILYYKSTSTSQECWLLVGSNGKVFCCYGDWSGIVTRTIAFATNETVHCVNTIDPFLVVAGSNGKLYRALKNTPNNTQLFTPFTSTFGSSSDILAMKLCSGKLFIVGEDGKMAYSSNASTWTAVADTSFEGTTIRDIAYGNGKYVAVGDEGKTAVSDDGINWAQQANTFEGTDIRSVTYGNGTFVAVGAEGKIAYWTP